MLMQHHPRLPQLHHARAPQRPSLQPNEVGVFVEEGEEEEYSSRPPPSLITKI